MLCPATFSVEDGHRLFDPTGFVCDDDIAAVIRTTGLAIGISLDKPEDDPERRIAIINEQGHKVGNVPVYSKPSYKNPANRCAATSALAFDPAASRLS